MVTNNHYTVYMHIFPNGKRYIGLTGQNVKQRWRKDGNGYKPQKLVYSAIKKYGWNNIEHIIIVENLTVFEASNLEKTIIGKFNTTDPNLGYNQSIGGENSPIGVKRSEETKRKLSISHKGITHNKGYHLRAEQRKRLREVNLWKKLSEETKRKISEKNKKYKPTEFAIKRLKEVCNKPVKNIETNIFYDSATIASQKTGIPRNTITRHCRKEVKKPKWMYLL